MADTGSQDWDGLRLGVVRGVAEKLEFVAFLDTREDAGAAAAEGGSAFKHAGYATKTASAFTRGKR